MTKKNFDEKNLRIKHFKNDLRIIHKNKNHLAIRWIIASLKQLLYRDRHLFKLISEKVA